MNDTTDVFEAVHNICILSYEIANNEDPRIHYVRKISYGFIMPIICFFGIIGNILNLIVLTRRNMQGIAYIYMRGYSVASLMAISFCIPFTLRVLIHKEIGGWISWPQAFYHVHLELYLGNGCLGVGVMMLLALTVERHASICSVPPDQYGRPACGPPHLTVLILPLATFLVYLPSVFRAEIRSCASGRQILYHKRDNLLLMQSSFYQVYKVMLEVLFKVGPTVLLAGLNLRIMLVFKRRRRMRRNHLAEERRLSLLLGSTSLLFLVCVSPMVILNVTLSEDNLSLFYYQVFRALANLLEVTNYSMTFYIYCLFSEDFRSTLIRTLKWPWVTRAGRQLADPRVPTKASLGTTTQTPSPSSTQRTRPTATKPPPLSPRRDFFEQRFT